MAFAGFGAKPAAATTTTTTTGATPTATSATGAKGMFGSTAGSTNPFGGNTGGGGLFGSSNTNTTGGTGLFGQQQQQQPATGGGLFGQTQQQQPATGGGGLFGQNNNATGGGGGLFGSTTNTNTQGQTGGGLFGNNNQQQQSTGGLFGNNAANNTSNQTGTTGGLFGSTNNANQQTGTTGGLFGNNNANTGTGTTGGLFGNTNNTTTSGGLFGNSANTTTGTSGGLFGNNNANTTTGTTGGLFGNTNTNNQQTTGGGLFGNSTTQTGGGGLFGNTNTQQGTGTGGGLFGASTTNPGQASTGFGGSLFNKQPSQAPGQQPQQQLGLTTTNQAGNVPFTKSTKFNDLPENIRKVLETIDTHIQGRLQVSKELKQRKLGEEPTKGLSSIRELHKELIDITNTIRKDVHLTKDLKEKVDQAVEDTIVATRIIDGFRNPQGGNTYLKDHANFPLEFFTRVTEQMSQRLAWYKSTIEQIERKLSASTSQAQTPQGIVQTLQTQHSTFLALASKTAALDAEVQKLKAIYTQLWRSKTGSVRDPFNDSAKASGPESGLDYSLSGLNLSSTR